MELLLFLLVAIFTSSSQALTTNYRLRTREDPPPIPERPATSGPGSFHGSQFQFLEHTGYAPAVDAMPVFVFSTTQSEFQPCYPESGVELGSGGQNPGTDVPINANPGTNCNDPGPLNGAYTLGNSFPTYVSASWCGAKGEWRIQYYNYYVHDGMLTYLGHKHDWEGISVIWQKDPEGDWWHRAGAVYNKHCMHDWYRWDQLNTVDVDVPGTTDVSDESTGQNKRHPKVSVGFFSHASFPERNTDRKTIFNGKCPEERDLLGDEYRSNDWWRLPRLEDIRPASDIDPSWDYGSATSTPWKNIIDQCSW